MKQNQNFVLENRCEKQPWTSHETDLDISKFLPLFLENKPLPLLTAPTTPQTTPTCKLPLLTFWLFKGFCIRVHEAN